MKIVLNLNIIIKYDKKGLIKDVKKVIRQLDTTYLEVHDKNQVLVKINSSPYKMDIFVFNWERRISHRKLMLVTVSEVLEIMFYRSVPKARGRNNCWHFSFCIQGIFSVFLFQQSLIDNNSNEVFDPWMQ